MRSKGEMMKMDEIREMHRLSAEMLRETDSTKWLDLTSKLAVIMSGGEASSAVYDSYTYTVMMWKFLNELIPDMGYDTKFEKYRTIGWKGFTERREIYNDNVHELTSSMLSIARSGTFSAKSICPTFRKLNYHEHQALHEGQKYRD